ACAQRLLPALLPIDIGGDQDSSGHLAHIVTDGCARKSKPARRPATRRVANPCPESSSRQRYASTRATQSATHAQSIRGQRVANGGLGLKRKARAHGYTRPIQSRDDPSQVQAHMSYPCQGIHVAPRIMRFRTPASRSDLTKPPQLGRMVGSAEARTDQGSRNVVGHRFPDTAFMRGGNIRTSAAGTDLARSGASPKGLWLARHGGARTARSDDGDV